MAIHDRTRLIVLLTLVITAEGCRVKFMSASWIPGCSGLGRAGVFYGAALFSLY